MPCKQLQAHGEALYRERRDTRSRREREVRLPRPIQGVHIDHVPFKSFSSGALIPSGQFVTGKPWEKSVSIASLKEG